MNRLNRRIEYYSSLLKRGLPLFLVLLVIELVCFNSLVYSAISVVNPPPPPPPAHRDESQIAIKKISLNGDTAYDLGSDGKTTPMVYVGPRKSSIKVTVYLSPYDMNQAAGVASHVSYADWIQIYYKVIPTNDDRTIRINFSGKAGPQGAEYAFSGDIPLGFDRPESKAFETQYLQLTKIEVWGKRSFIVDDPFPFNFCFLCPPIRRKLESRDTLVKNYSFSEILTGQWPVQILVNDLATQVSRITDLNGDIKSPEINSVQVQWGNDLHLLQRGKNNILKKRSDNLEFKINLNSYAPQVRPRSVHLMLFRSDSSGDFRRGSGQEDYIEQYLDLNNYPTLKWGELIWKVDPKKFRKGTKEFSDAAYLLEIEVVPIEYGGVTETVVFKILGETPVTTVDTEQKGIDGLEFSFVKKKSNTRYDVSVSKNPMGPYYLLTRDVMDPSKRPPNDPWFPTSTNLSYREEPWQFITGEENHKFFVTFEKIRQSVGLRYIPSKLYFRFRAIDEAGNTFDNVYERNPYEVKIKKEDSRPPSLVIDKSDGSSIKITDFGDFSPLKGTLRDRSPWGERNAVWIYLEKNNVVLSSTVVIAPDNVLVGWNLSVPERFSAYLPNGSHRVDLVSIDIDGNEIRTPLTLIVDVVPFELAIKNPYYTKSFEELREGNKKGFIDFQAQTKEGSYLSLSIDGKPWLSDVLIGSNRNFSSRIYSDFALKEGKHRAFAYLVNREQRKDVLFDLIVDNRAPQIVSLKSPENNETFLTLQETQYNITSKPFLYFKTETTDESPVTLYDWVSGSIDEISQILASGNGELFPPSGRTIPLLRNSVTYIGFVAVDDAGNSSSIRIYPVYYDSNPPKISVKTLEQTAPDLKTFDRNNLLVTLEGETDPMSARYDLSVSLSQNGPWNLVSRSVIENPPSKTPWLWNDLLRNEKEWLSTRKVNDQIIPYNLGLDTIKTILKVDQIPGTRDQAILYIKARSQDFAGNTYESPPQPFTLTIDRRAPLIELYRTDHLIIDYDRQGGSISGRVLDEPSENQPITIQLMKDNILISETVTSTKFDGEFSLSIPKEKSLYLPNGQHFLKIIAKDVDGNRSEFPVSVQVDIKPFEIEIPERVYSRTGPGSKDGLTALELDIPIVPNSLVSLKVDGKEIINSLNSGPNQRFRTSIDLPSKLNPGEHSAWIQLSKRGNTLSKPFTLIIDNDPPGNVKLLSTSENKTLLSVRETESNILASSLVRLQASASDRTELTYQFGVGGSIESARREMLASPKQSNIFFPVLKKGEINFIALGVVDQSGNLSENYYPLFIRNSNPTLLISNVQQKSEDETHFDRKLVWFNFESDEENWSRLRYDLSVSLDESNWKLVTRDVIDQPPAKENWLWRSGLGERWENLSGSKSNWVPYVNSVSKIREALGIDSLPVKNGKGYFYARIRAVDFAGNRSVPQSLKIELELDQNAPSLGLDTNEDVIRIVDFGARPGALINGWVKDQTDGNNFVDISLLKNGFLINKTRVFTEPNVSQPWQIYIPESASAILRNGSHPLTLKAQDVDGNTQFKEISVDIDVVQEEMRFEDPIYVAPIARNGKTNILFTGVFKENSYLTVLIDGKTWLSNFPTGSSRYLETYLQSSERLTEGDHTLTAKILRDGITKQKSGRLIVSITPPKIQKIMDFPETSQYFISSELTEFPWNSVNTLDLEFKANVSDPQLSQVRYTFGSDPNTVLRMLESGLYEVYTNSAKVRLQPNQIVYVALEAENKAGLKSQVLIPFLYDLDPPKIGVSKIEQKSQDNQNYDRNLLWFYFKSAENENSRPRFDLSVSTDLNGSWFLISRDVIDQPPKKSPWVWNLNAGMRWQNLVSQGGSSWSPLVVHLEDIRNAMHKAPLPNENGTSYFFVRVRSIDGAGNVWTNEDQPYKAVIQTDRNSPELSVSGQSGTIRIYDFGHYGGLSGTVKDRPFEPGNFTQIFLVKDGVAVATAAVRTDQDVFARWDLVIPESAREIIKNGEQSLGVVARDTDGNETHSTIKVNVEISDLFVDIANPLYTRSDQLFDRTKKASFNLRAKVKENSELTLEVDGKVWVSGLNVGSRKDLDERFESDFSLSEGIHKAKLSLVRGGQSITKEFDVIVDNAPPKIVQVVDSITNQTLRQESENIIGNTEMNLKVSVNEPNYKEGRYVLSDDYVELGRMIQFGKKINELIPINLPGGTSTFLGIEIEDRAGNLTRQIYSIASIIDSPSTTFDPKYFLVSPEEEVSSGNIAVAYNGRDSVVLSGQMGKKYAPGNVELVGFRKKIESGTDFFGRWQLIVPASVIPQGEESNVYLELMGKNTKKSKFNLKIVQVSEVAKILLDEPIPEYVKTNSLLIKGVVQSQTPIESFEAFLRPEIQRFYLVSNGNVVRDRWNRADYDAASGKFSIIFQGLDESKNSPHSLELTARTNRGQETVYVQKKDEQWTLPIFFVDSKVPNPPTLKIAARIENGIIFEGIADSDPGITVVLNTSDGKILGKTQVFTQIGDDKGSWSRKIENLLPGDYEVYAYVKDLAGNQSLNIGPEKFTIYKGFGSKPKLNDFSKGRETYSETSRPTLTGNAGIPNSQVQTYETGNYIGGTLSDSEGNFVFTPNSDLKNGWKNFFAVAYDGNGQRAESDVLRIYMNVNGVPIEERLIVKPEPKTSMERQTISLFVASKEGVPMRGARVVFVGQEAETNDSGRVDLVTPPLQGSNAMSVPIKAEVILKNGVKLSGSNFVDVVAGDHWDIRFSPNNDGINDFVVFNEDDLPIKIQQFRTDEIVKIVRNEDGNRWDGKKSNGIDCETGLYLARTNRGKPLVIQILR